jgi:signal transduction histidine kinase
LPEVRVDAEAMIQVFVNLLDNAMKYSGRCRQVCVDMRHRGGDVAVYVVDGGIGIAPAEQTRIFDEFYRAAGSHGVAGTGLGLAIVRQIVFAHGGRVEVASRLGCGATFTVLLPAVKMVREDAGMRSRVTRRQIEVRA